MNIFLEELSKQFPDDIILLCCDGAAWHKAGSLLVPENVSLFFIPPYTPEMNPIEVFATLEKVVDRLCDTISSLTAATIHSITARSWIVSCFN